MKRALLCEWPQLWLQQQPDLTGLSSTFCATRVSETGSDCALALPPQHPVDAGAESVRVSVMVELSMGTFFHVVSYE